MSKRELDEDWKDDTDCTSTKKRKLAQATERELFCYEGERNERGEFHGFGKLCNTQSPFDKYIGYFHNGAFHGYGVLFLDLDGASMLIGHWEKDSLQGKSIMITEMQHLVCGQFQEGVQNGECKEYVFHSFEFDFNRFMLYKILPAFDKRRLLMSDHDDATMSDRVFELFRAKFALTLVFDGNYSDDQRNGHGTVHFEDGGRITGEWKDGVLHDENAVYCYPNYQCRLRGVWANGEMKKATFIDHDASIDTHEPSQTNCSKEEILYCYDPADDTSIGAHALLRSPYETNRVFVAKSTLKEAGSGLFAKCDIKQGELICFYNGLRLKHGEVDDRSWEQNGNALTINDEVCVDIPPHLATEEAYCASLGHFANHHWYEQNAEYQPFYSPRFGDIKCLRATKNIGKHQEIFVDYDYKDEFPKWYQQFTTTSKHVT